MKQLELYSYLWRLLVLQILLAAPMVQAQEGSSSIMVNYDKQKDNLMITAEAVSLKSVLIRVAQKTGIEVLFDDAADREVTFDISAAPLNEVVKHMIRDTNNALSYNKNDEGKSLLVGIMILATGQEDSRPAQPLILPSDEAYHYATQSRMADGMPVDQAGRSRDVSVERWQARMEALPTDRQERLEKLVANRIAEDEFDKQNKAERDAERKRMRAEQQTKIDAQRQAVMEGLDPERRAQLEQIGLKVREEVRQQVQNNQ